MTGTLYGLVKHGAHSYPDRPALDFVGRVTSYGELVTKIERIAAGLESLGVGPGDMVGICAPNCPQAIESIYACNRTGAVAVLLNPLSPPQQLCQQLRCTACKVLIILDVLLPGVADAFREAPCPTIHSIVYLSLTTEFPPKSSVLYALASLPKILRARTTVVKMSRWRGPEVRSWSSLLSEGTRIGRVNSDEPAATAPAIVIFSGGTTGNPKPVVHSSESINHSSQQCLSIEPPIVEGVSMLAVLPFFHIFGLVVAINICLISGVTCILVPRFKAEDVARIIMDARPTYMAGVPTIYEAVLQSETFSHAERAGTLDFSRLRVGFCGGDKIAPVTLRRFNELIARNKGTGRLLDGYGLTEVCPVTVMPRNGDGPEGSIGVPIPGIDIRVVELGTKRSLPAGDEGEICVSGKAVMTGYLEERGLTKENILLHDDGRWWLHTGDVGYLDEDGYLFFKYRLRQIIKVSGNTVYLTEVEEVISRHPAVAKVAAVPEPFESGQVRVKAVIVPARDVSRQEILAHCRQMLPPWAIPVSIEFRKEIPTNLLGKTAWGQL